MSDTLIRCLSKSSSFFDDKAVEVPKRIIETNEAEKESKQYDTGAGCVYVFESNTDVLYVGQTGTSLRKRARYATSKHIEKDWWKKVDRIRICQLGNSADRLALEMLLIVKLQPSVNKRPSRSAINCMQLKF
ncbi:hypothetical protein [Marinagarivorans cellulosilyticus]|uniref:GIY-YIG domain-containing protein n=1 Tax=Marinagarivorans cellulosilyticus TaxID=2721545 RepID=A0AAN2BK53_9GAMM|nr:hypothetical protein [Marinagarivorans cellulosilyticus]BCD97713.1 hypothetical protein MARGE09_P1914 [Marinagarivorans cellulosilyticus]